MSSTKVPCGREQRGVVRLPVLEARGVVHGDVLHGGQRAGPAELDFAHVAHVEQAHAGAHGHVLGDQAAAGAGYSTGMSQPPKSTILALRARCVALRAVFFSAGATGAAGVDMGIPLRGRTQPR